MAEELTKKGVRDTLDRWTVQVKHNAGVVGDHFPHIYDPETGKVVKKDTLQGYDTDSCWSRGQAWGIYGFTQIYKFTGDPRFKERASVMAEYFLSGLPEDGVVFYDFNDPSLPSVPKDTSAQAIAAAGLFALAEVTTGTERGYYYDQGVDSEIAYGDYYIVEALMRYLSVSTW